MNDKLELRLITSEISNYTFDELYSTLANGLEDIVLEVPCRSINSSQYPTDLAYDYLWALFVSVLPLAESWNLATGLVRLTTTGRCNRMFGLGSPFW
jgi:hypothetical protein